MNGDGAQHFQATWAKGWVQEEVAKPRQKTRQVLWKNQQEKIQENWSKRTEVLSSSRPTRPISSQSARSELWRRSGLMITRSTDCRNSQPAANLKSCGLFPRDGLIRKWRTMSSHVSALLLLLNNTKMINAHQFYFVSVHDLWRRSVSEMTSAKPWALCNMKMRWPATVVARKVISAPNVTRGIWRFLARNGMSIKKPFSKKKIRTSLLSNDDNVKSTSKATSFVQYQDDQ